MWNYDAPNFHCQESLYLLHALLLQNEFQATEYISGKKIKTLIESEQLNTGEGWGVYTEHKLELYKFSKWCDGGVRCFFKHAEMFSQPTPLHSNTSYIEKITPFLKIIAIFYSIGRVTFISLVTCKWIVWSHGYFNTKHLTSQPIFKKYIAHWCKLSWY